MSEKILCGKCGSVVIESFLTDYSYQCLLCDEDFYLFEITKENYDGNENLSEWFSVIERAYQEFASKELGGGGEDDKLDSNEKYQPICISEDNWDSEERKEYSIECYLDLNNKLDMFEMVGKNINAVISCETTYAQMTENLYRASYDDWIASCNGVDYDDLAELEIMYLEGLDVTEKIKEITEYAEKRERKITIKLSKGEN